MGGLSSAGVCLSGHNVQLLPGGTQEFVEPLSLTLRIKVREETGIGVRVDRLLWVWEFVERNHLRIEGHGDHVVESIYRCVP